MVTFITSIPVIVEVIANKKVCFAWAITSGYDDNSLVIKEPEQSEHNHAKNREEVESEKLRGRLKRAAENHPDQHLHKFFAGNYVVSLRVHFCSSTYNYSSRYMLYYVYIHIFRNFGRIAGTA